MKILCIMQRPKSEFTDKQIDNKRRQLARQWSQTINQILDEEAIYYLRKNYAQA